jgi:hypothetical protein
MSSTLDTDFYFEDASSSSDDLNIDDLVQDDDSEHMKTIPTPKIEKRSKIRQGTVSESLLTHCHCLTLSLTVRARGEVK